MQLEAVWFKDGKKVFKISPVINIVCDDDMDGVQDIEINDGRRWYEYKDIPGGADDFVIRVMKD